MKKNYLLLNFIVLLFSMTFGGYALQPTAADVYTPTVTDDEVSVFLETSYTDNIKVYAWIDESTKFTKDYPGDEMTFMGKTADGKKTSTNGPTMVTKKRFLRVLSSLRTKRKLEEMKTKNSKTTVIM